MNTQQFTLFKEIILKLIKPAYAKMHMLKCNTDKRHNFYMLLSVIVYKVPQAIRVEW